MKCLAIECSSAVGSAALLDGDEVLVQRDWTGRNRGNGPLFEALEICVGRLPGGYDEVEAMAVGRGPGNYSGMRAALAAAQALALPTGCPVLAVSSGMAAARQAGRDGVIWIVGDARRGQWWAGGFRIGGDVPGEVADWQLIEPEALAGLLSPGETVATPDWERIGSALPACAGDGARIVEGPVYPAASTVGALAVARFRQGEPSEPLTPLYMHPPVARTPQRAPE